MGVYKEGKNWKVQVYYKDWQGNRKRKQKRGFRTKGEAKEYGIVKFTDEREITSARLHLVAQNLRTLYFLIRYSGGDCQFDIIFL